MVDTFASVADLEDSLGRSLTGDETGRAVSALRYASALVRGFAPWVDTLTPVPDGVVVAVAAMAERRFLGRRDGATAHTVGSVSVQYAQQPRSVDVFTADERALLVAALGVGSGLVTVSLAGPP